MATTVNQAFAEFIGNTVNLAPAITRSARGSRDWLLDQLNGLDGKSTDVPHAYPDRHIYFGSFARRTKIRELDDIDILFCLAARGATYADVAGTVQISAAAGTRLASLCYAGTSLVNSRLVINTFVRAVPLVPQYENSDVSRSGEAAVLKLSSQTWNFDIVPGFFTTPEYDGRTYYIIPDGAGHWKKTDPRLDRDRVAAVNQAHDGHVLNVVRLMKYWNRRPTMPTIPSYMFECMLLNYFESAASVSSYVDLEVAPVLTYIESAVWGAVYDPKGIQGDLNSLAPIERSKVAARAAADRARAQEARAAETEGDHSKSIRRWSEVFGPSFPAYG